MGRTKDAKYVWNGKECHVQIHVQINIPIHLGDRLGLDFRPHLQYLSKSQDTPNTEHGRTTQWQKFGTLGKLCSESEWLMLKYRNLCSFDRLGNLFIQLKLSILNICSNSHLFTDKLDDLHSFDWLINLSMELHSSIKIIHRLN